MPNWVMNEVSIQSDASYVNEILEAIKHDKGELGSFDFNKVLPMPESLNVTSGSITEEAISAFISKQTSDNVLRLMGEKELDPDGEKSFDSNYWKGALESRQLFRRNIDETLTEKQIESLAEKHNMSVEDFLALGKQYIDNYREYGAVTWYEWCNENWGTKWNLNPQDCHFEDGYLSFSTAWSAPFPLIEELSKMFSSARFDIRWADEDRGCNVGEMSYLNGEIVEEFIPESCSKEAYELYFEVWGESPEECDMVYNEKVGNYVYVDTLEEAPPALEDKLADAQNRLPDHASSGQEKETVPER